MVNTRALFFLVGALVVFFDQLSKFFIRSFFSYTTNTGIAFGLLRGYQPFLILITLVIIGIILYYGREYPLALGLLLGGAVGNLLDRLFFGAVIDFIDLGFWPSFNFADSANTIGVAILLWQWLREQRTYS